MAPVKYLEVGDTVVIRGVVYGRKAESPKALALG